MCYSVNDTGIPRQRKSEGSYQELNLRPSDYYVWILYHWATGDSWELRPLNQITRFIGQTSCILLGLECQRVTYAQWNKCDGICWAWWINKNDVHVHVLFSDWPRHTQEKEIRVLQNKRPSNLYVWILYPVHDTGIVRKKKKKLECSYQELNPRPSDKHDWILYQLVTQAYLEEKEIRVLLSGVEPKNVMHSESANGGHFKEFWKEKRARFCPPYQF